MRKLLLVLAACALIRSSVLAQGSLTQPGAASKLRLSTNCAAAACSAVNQVCVQSDLPNRVALYSCDVSTKKFKRVRSVPVLAQADAEADQGTLVFVAYSGLERACEGKLALKIQGATRCLEGLAP